MNCKKGIKRLFLSFILALFAFTALVSCSKKDDGGVIIYTSTEDFRTEHIQQLLKEKFPKYKITVQVLSTGNHAAKLKAEGLATEADIVLNLETGYLEALQDMFENIEGYGLSEFLPELIPQSSRYAPWDKSSGAIIINRDKIKELKLPVPSSYNDLLNPVYKGLISMPSPKTSGTGYMFLVSLINEWGEKEAFNYFDKLSENILQFTTSGSGPVNALIQGEAAIGLGMTLTAVQAINSRSMPFDILYFKEGAPSITTGMALVKGHDSHPAVKEVFKYAITKLNRDDKELYCPEQIFKTQENNIQNYPKNIVYSKMEGVYDIMLKNILLSKWKY